MKWPFAKRASIQRSKVDTRLNPKSKRLLWSLICTLNKRHLQSKKKSSFHEDSATGKLRKKKKSMSVESLSDLIVTNPRLSKLQGPITTLDSMLIHANLLAFCPTCQGPVKPLLGNICQNNNLYNYWQPQEQNIYAEYECVYTDCQSLVDSLDDVYSIFDRSHEQWTSSTIKRHADDSQTIYDEVALDDDDESTECVESRKFNRSILKRCALQMTDSVQQVKRMRREFYVCEV